MKQISIEGYLIEIKQAFPEYEFHLEKQGHGWYRAFVIYDGVSLGRINFEPINNGWRLYPGTPKYYKPSDYEYNKMDDFFYQFHHWTKTENRISIDHLIPIAKENIRIRNRKQWEWRIDNPLPLDKNGNQRHRKKLCSNWMGEFRRLVREECIKIGGNNE